MLTGWPGKAAGGWQEFTCSSTSGWACWPSVPAGQPQPGCSASAADSFVRQPIQDGVHLLDFIDVHGMPETGVDAFRYICFHALEGRCCFTYPFNGDVEVNVAAADEYRRVCK